MSIQEITADKLNPREFIKEKVEEIQSTVGDGLAINALSGGVDSSTVTMLSYKALHNRLKTYFIDNGLMRQDEPQRVVSLFKNLGIHVELINAQDIFFKALTGLTDPEEKRNKGITQPFYKDVFSKLIKQTDAKFLLHGTILTDIDETVAGIKRQHNVFEQIGIDPQQEFGYKIVEPLIQLRKDGVRKIAKELGLPESVYNQIPFPGPALATRIEGEVTPEKVDIVRKATAIVEKELAFTKAFQYMAILQQGKVTGMMNNKRALGYQIQVRCWDSVDARTATPTRLSDETKGELDQRTRKEIPEVVSVNFHNTPKPPSCIEAV